MYLQDARTSNAIAFASPLGSVTVLGDIESSSWAKAYSLLAIASAVVSGYHGVKRHNSVLWGVLWFGLGGLFPVITPTIAFAQGYAKPMVG